MTFADKLTDLLNMTGTTTTSLAKALNMDRSNISRMKTGARGTPKEDIIQNISDFFAQHLKEEHLLGALYELTSDVRLQSRPSGWVLSNVLFTWLSESNDAERAKNQVGHFLHSIDKFTPAAQIRPDSAVTAISLPEGSVASYYDNAGKRQAFRDFIAYVLTLETPCTLQILSDECTDWLIEDAGFMREFNQSIAQLVEKGFKFERIQPPASNIELSFRAIERWIPAYLAGAITQYYYPFERDNLYRRTLFIAQDRIVLQSLSLNRQSQGRVTLLSTDRQLVHALSEDFKDVAGRCRHMMNLHTMDKPEHLFQCIADIDSIEDTGIYKSSTLSVISLPQAIIDRVRSSGRPFAAQMCDTWTQRLAHREKVLQDNIIVDMVHLVPPEEIMRGRQEIPGTKMIPGTPFYYTPEEYILHLENILWLLNHCPHYQLVLANDALFAKVILYVKGIHRAILVKHDNNFAIIEITEQHMVALLYDYLRHMADENMSVGSRHTTIERVETEIQTYRELLARR